jgi:hypothetical protein
MFLGSVRFPGRRPSRLALACLPLALLSACTALVGVEDFAPGPDAAEAQARDTSPPVRHNAGDAGRQHDAADAGHDHAAADATGPDHGSPDVTAGSKDVGVSDRTVHDVHDSSPPDARDASQHDAAGLQDATPPLPVTDLPCGALACTAGKQVCCVTGLGSSTMATECLGGGAGCPSGAVSIACGMSSQCQSGQVCCATLDGVTPTGVACAAACNPPDAVVACEPGEPNSCPGEATCTPSQEGYGFCGPSGSGGGSGTDDTRSD